MNRALLIGINAYPQQPLQGCVNDVQRVSAYLVEHAGFLADEIRMLVDRRATRAALLQGPGAPGP